jgi:pimeloyl-ACP methyl ester carboxylesterase
MPSFLAQLREPDRARASSALYRTFLSREFLPILHGRYKAMRLLTPTLFLLGAQDAVIRPAFVRGYERHADDMHLELVDGAGHFIAEEAPDIVLDRTLDFFGRPSSLAST